MWFDTAKGGERDGAKGHDQGRLHGVESLAEPVAAGGEFRWRGRPVSPARIERKAEGRVGHEDTLAGEPGFAQKAFESRSCCVAGKGHAGPARAEAARGFADE